MTQGRVLILDGHFMSALAIARSLGQQGIDVVLAGPEPKPLAAYSRYVNQYEMYPDPGQDLDGFLDAIEALVRRTGARLLIPVTEKTLIPLSEQRQRFESMTTVALPPNDALTTVLDKQATTLLAAQLDVCVPASESVSSLTELHHAVERIGFPVVLKPIHSVSRVDGAIGPQLTVTYAFDTDELKRVGEPLLRHGDVVVQEYFQGTGCGVEVIADHGELRYAFQHRRLHELPLSGGGSCLREAVAVDDQLLAATKKMVSALKWHGVAMFEFKSADDGSYRLIEINGRFWGSLPLSVAAGADFPWYAWQLYTGEQPLQSAPYRNGTLCRDLAKDLYWHEYVIRRVTDSRLFAYPTNHSLLRGLLQFFLPRHYVDSWRWFDPLPGVIEAGRLMRHYTARVSELLQQKWRLRTQLRAWRSGDLPQRLKDSKRLLILCYGNINRSAAAHAYLLNCLPEADYPSIVSAGFHKRAGRPADPRMVQVAAQHGVDMSGCRSVSLTPAMVDDADLILAMELQHIDRVKQISPGAANKCFLWGAALADSETVPEIDDPYGHAFATYERCFKRLAKAGDEILAAGGGWTAGCRAGPHQPSEKAQSSQSEQSASEVIDAKFG